MTIFIILSIILFLALTHYVAYKAGEQAGVILVNETRREARGNRTAEDGTRRAVIGE